MAKAKALHSDFGTPRRKNHGPVYVEEVPKDLQDTGHRDRAVAEPMDDPLYYYRRNKTISPLQYDAGIRLREYWHATGMEPSVVGRYSDMVAQGSVESLLVLGSDNQRRYADAMRSIGPVASNEVVKVCCMQERIRSAYLEILRRGLNELIRHFKWG